MKRKSLIIVKKNRAINKRRIRRDKNNFTFRQKKQCKKKEKTVKTSSFYFQHSQPAQ